MMKRQKLRYRITSLCLAVLLCLSALPFAAFAKDAELPAPASSASEIESANEVEGGETESPEQSSQAQAFVDAVAALDRDAILAAVNAWALASQAWQADPDNPDLIAALDAAIAASDEAAAPVYAADELYTALSDTDKAAEAVSTAYTALASLVLAMQSAMEHPVPPDDGGDGSAPPDLDEITRMLYHDLPDAPTGSYIGSHGLPVATGTTKIGIGAWKDEQMAPDAGYLDAEALNADGLTITVPRQAGEKIAIAPIMVQVEYPADGSTSQIILPDDVTLLDYEGNPADETTANSILNAVYTESSAAAAGIYVQADHDFTARFAYTAPDGSTLEKSLTVHLEGVEQTTRGGAATYEVRPTPAVTTGKITSIAFVGGTWLIWFNGEPAYCCTHGANGQPAGCPTYTYAYTSTVGADQYTPGDHYANQINIWGGLDQLSLGFLSADATLETAYDAEQLWIIEHYPDSVAAQSYLRSYELMTSGAATYAAASDYYTYIYLPPIDGWQTVALIGPPVENQDYYADWTAQPQTASGSFDAAYTVNADKTGLETGETVDGAVIEIEPLEKGGAIDGGTWTLAPADKQTVTTTGHAMDDSYQASGGTASASWSLHYDVEQTSVSELSGRVGPYSSQAEADAAAAAARSSAEEQLRTEAQDLVDQAIASARAELASLDFRFNETVVPVGFEPYDGAHGSTQTISVPMDSANSYPMRNDEWSLQINIRKVDSETGEQIASDAAFEVFEWDVVTQKYIPFGGYNQYTVVRNPDGTYSVANGSNYGTEYDASRKLYYTQRNEGRFIIVETKAPDGYNGDWTDITQPGEAGTPLGKRGYFIQITAENDCSVIWLDNADYNADIATSYTGGTKLLTGDGAEATVTIYEKPQDTSPISPEAGVFQNIRATGEIVLTKYDLDQGNGSAAQHGEGKIDGAIYDLYAAEDILHPDGVTGVVDYSKIVNADGEPIRETTVRNNSGWDDHYLPVLAKDHLVASAEITDGTLTFSDLYLGRYYIVERATGFVFPVDADGKFYVTGEYPLLDRKLEPTGETQPLARSGGEYTEYVYKNQYSAVAEGRALDGTKTYDGYYLSFAEGYLCDEVNHYLTLSYGDESARLVRAQTESADAILKGGFSVQKLLSTTGPGSPAPELEGAGFTVYRIPDLSKADQFTLDPDGSYNIQSVLDVYRKDNYDSETLKYDFSAEEQAVARMFESDAGLVASYNETLTEAGDYANGSGLGWVATGTPNEYCLSELYTNENGVLRVTGLPYGQYIVVETTIPNDVFQADPFEVNIDSTTPQSVFCQPNGSTSAPSNSFLTYNVLDEEMEGYLRLVKIDAETGKAVRMADTAFAVYRLHEDGTRERLSMADPDSGDPTEKTDVFYTDSEGRMKTPEKLPLGRYLIEELEGPSGYCNDKAYSVEFEVTSERVWEVVGSAVDGMDEYILTERYLNHETLGKLTIRKTGEVLAGGQYEERPLAGAEFTITAAEDIYTPDHQLDASGNRTLWYAEGDVVAVVTTGDGTSDIAVFRPGRTQATYDFLSVIHDGTIGEVTVTLPLGSYHVEETKPPYGYTASAQSYDVTLAWSDQDGAVVETQPLVFENEREKAQIKVAKEDSETGERLARAVFDLYTVDAIYDADGVLLCDAGDLLATSAPTGEDGTVVFDCDVPMRSEDYGREENTNSGRYRIVEAKQPEGYFLNTEPMEFTFLYTGAEVQVFENTCRNEATSFAISKREVTGAEELPGASLEIQDQDGNVVREWVSGDQPIEIRGLHFDEVYTLVETLPADGYALAESIRFKLTQTLDEDGNPLPENDVYVCTGRDWLVFDHWELLADGVVVMRDDVIRVEISKQDIATKEELPGAHLVIKDAGGNVIEEWVSSDKPHKIEKLPAGQYVLIETLAPDGYQVAESIEFEVMPTGELQTVVMYDERTPTPEQPTPPSSIPQTGDFSWPRIALGCAAILSGIGLLILNNRRRFFDDDATESRRRR